MDVLLAARPSAAPPAGSTTASPSRPAAAAVLGLEPGEANPVRIILAAQLRLRRYRRDRRRAAHRDHAAEMHRIAEARDLLLRQTVGQLTAQIGKLGGSRQRSKKPRSSGAGVG